MNIIRVLCCLVFATLAEAQESRPFCAWLAPDLAAKVPRVLTLMREGLHQEKPSGRPRSDAVAGGPQTLFTGSYDRHSNIAAYWSLINWARRSADERERRNLMTVFSVDALARERAYVETIPRGMVGPYGEAWLFLLLREIARNAGSPELRAAADAFAESLEDRLLTYAEEAPRPGTVDAQSRPRERAESRPAGNGSRPDSRSASRPVSRRIPRDQWLSGTYDSALWPLILVELGGPMRSETPVQLRRLRAGRLPETAAAFAARTAASRHANTYEFLQLSALLALADGLDAGADVRSHGFVPEAFCPAPEKITLGNCHMLGAQLSATWPLALDAARASAGARAAFEDRLRLCLEREDAWDGPFLTVSHWVPQFVYFALWLADGRD